MATPLVVMTWNVRYFGHALRGLASTKGAVTRAASALAALVPLPDLVALQEVETRSLRAGMHAVPQIERFLDALHAALAAAGRPERFTGLYYPAHSYKVPGAPPLYTTGLAILVGPRLEVEAHNTTEPHEITALPSHALRGLKQRRIVAHVRVRPREGGPSLDLFNTHLSLPSFREVGPHRVPSRMGHGSNQLAEVLTLLDVVRSRAGEAAVVVGDFNTRPGSPAYRAMLDAGLVDAWEASAPSGATAGRTHATAGFATARMHIDHVFSTPSLRWEEVTGFPYGSRHAFHGLSDHTPKIGRILLPS